MTAQTGTATAAPAPSIEVRQKVRDVLLRSPAFRELQPEKQQQIARDMAQVADYLCKPEGIAGNTLPTAAALAGPDGTDVHGAFQDNLKQVNKVGQGFKAQAALQGAEVAGALL